MRKGTRWWQQGCPPGAGHIVTFPPSLWFCSANAKSVMDAYFVYSNGTALDASELNA